MDFSYYDVIGKDKAQYFDICKKKTQNVYVRNIFVNLLPKLCVRWTFIFSQCTSCGIRMKCEKWYCDSRLSHAIIKYKKNINTETSKTLTPRNIWSLKTLICWKLLNSSNKGTVTKTYRKMLKIYLNYQYLNSSLSIAKVNLFYIVNKISAVFCKLPVQWNELCST